LQVNPRRLYRSRDRQLAGVAGGMAEYLDIDPTVVRILWIILALVIPQAPYATAPGASAGWTTAGASAGWSTAPGAATGWTTPPAAPAWDPEPAVNAAAPAAKQQSESRGIGAGAIVGVVLIVVGAIALADAVLPGWVGSALLGPAVILALGAALLVSSIRRDADVAPAAAAPTAPTASVGSATVGSATVVGSVAAAQPWDVTDTQSVDPATQAGAAS
jgi:phage shock protein C